MREAFHRRGFTLVELAVTTAILAIMLACASASGRWTHGARELDCAARELHSALCCARQTALSGESVTVTLSARGWQLTQGARTLWSATFGSTVTASGPPCVAFSACGAASPAATIELSSEVTGGRAAITVSASTGACSLRLP